MELVSLKLSGFKRFEKETTIDLAGGPIALIGPNEAGKSSVLDALLSLNRDIKIARQHRTRSFQETTSIRAVFLLGDDDRRVVAHIRGGPNIRDYVLHRTVDADGKNHWWLEARPTPLRDLAARHALKARLQAIVDEEDILRKFTNAGNHNVSEVFAAALAALSSTSDSLSASDYEAIKLFPRVMRMFSQVTSSSPQNVHVTDSFRDFLAELDAYVEGASPDELVDEILIPRIPKVLEFMPQDRDLRSTYTLSEVAADPPLALRNLTALAGMDLVQLSQLRTHDDRAAREDYLGEANARLKHIFSHAWGQSSMTVRFVTQADTLELMVKTPEGKNSLMEDRSDGLRAFVALRAFLNVHSTDVPPILVVDEAETHLHYDAQAELIDLFTEQTEAAKIIYTTHSVGCLPRDLGTGVRVIEPVANKERSVVRKSIWADTLPGFRPLLIGLGAATFGFLPARNVVFTEGPTDAMLYPTLLREALEVPYLKFQVASGISSIRPDRLPELLNEGGAVAFLTDGDPGGVGYRESLRKSGVADERLFGLEGLFGEGTVVEDLIDPDAYRAAVVKELANHGITVTSTELTDLPCTNRPAFVASWCTEQNLPHLPSKARIAQHLLDQKTRAHREGSQWILVDPRRMEAVRSLGEKIEAYFSPSHRK